jgi:Holliday junction resolvase
MSKQKQKGTAAETAVLRYLQDKEIMARRLPLTGSKDQGDILISGTDNFTLEVKNHKEMRLAEWVDEAITERDNAGTDFGVVVHKRLRKGNPKDWYVTTTLEEFTRLISPQ